MKEETRTTWTSTDWHPPHNRNVDYAFHSSYLWSLSVCLRVGSPFTYKWNPKKSNLLSHPPILATHFTAMKPKWNLTKWSPELLPTYLKNPFYNNPVRWSWSFKIRQINIMSLLGSRYWKGHNVTTVGFLSKIQDFSTKTTAHQTNPNWGTLKNVNVIKFKESWGTVLD